jgi:hypothetical protein
VAGRTVGGSGRAVADAAERVVVGAGKSCSGKSDAGGSTSRGCCRPPQQLPPQCLGVPPHLPPRLAVYSPQRLGPCILRRARP